MTDEMISNNAKPRRWPKILLGVSLALNLLVLGVVGGAIWRFGGPHDMRSAPRSIGAAMFHELPREDRRALREGSSKGHADRRVRQQAEAKAVDAALRATPFDRAALETVLEGQSSQRAHFQKSVQDAWLDRIAGMSTTERLAYAERLSARLTERRYWDHHKDRRRDKDRHHD